mmetsp:Transcript_450/g.589  ORF Transcript_450/g.589 Transcript_450/m.589 type:complete len:146 (-) Transcript_450:276-713(-)
MKLQTWILVCCALSLCAVTIQALETDDHDHESESSAEAIFDHCLSDYTLTEDSCGSSCTSSEFQTFTSTTFEESTTETAYCAADSYTDIFTNLGDCASCEIVMDVLECFYDEFQEAHCDSSASLLSGSLFAIVACWLVAATVLFT